MNKTSRWLGPISGILFVAALALSNNTFNGIEAEPSDSASTALAAFQAGADHIGSAALIEMLGLGFLLLFLGDLRTRLRVKRGPDWTADGILAGGGALVVAVIIVTAFTLAGAVAGENGHVEVAQMAVDFLWEGTYLFTPGLLAFGISAAVAAFGNRAIPRWLGAIAVLVTLGALAPWLGILVFVAWVLAASVVELAAAFRPPVTVNP